jgi:very-short-patch-repair endonuclease
MRAKLNSEDCQKNINSRFGEGVYILNSTYTKSSDYINVIHTICGKEFSIIANDFTKEAKYRRFISTCPCCRRSKKLGENVVIERITELSNGNMKLIRYSGDTHSTSILQCNVCDYQTKISIHSFTNNLKNYEDTSKSWGCANCSKKKQKTTVEFSAQLEDLYKGKISLIGEYKNIHTHVALSCNICSGKWSTKPGNILRGSQCPLCLRLLRDSKELRRIMYVFETLDIDFEREVTFEGLRNKMQLYFDFCIEKDGNYFVVEFDGQQHFRGWQGCKKSLKENQIRDSIKNNFCKEYGIPLLRLNYEMNLGQIEEKLCAFIDHFKLL